MTDELEISIPMGFVGVLLLAAIAAHLLGYQWLAKAAFWLGIGIIVFAVLVVVFVLVIVVLAGIALALGR